VDALARISPSKSRSTQFSLPEIEKRIDGWGVDSNHAKVVRQHGEFLFDQLKTVHGLKGEWRPYLAAAALLHDVGETISHAHHAEHSEYMVKNANFVGMHGWEAQLIASLCRFHKEEKILEKKNEKKIPFEKKDELRPVFLKLLALLQIADACDRTHKSSLKLKSTRTTRAQVEIRYASKTPCDLELLRFEQKKTLFEQLFRKSVILKK